MECNSLTYSFTLVSIPFDTDGMCPRALGSQDFLMKEFYEKKFPPQFMRKLNEFRNNVSSNVADNCRNKIQYRAKLMFRLATDSMPVTVMSRRLSFFDKMSAFGKHIIKSFKNCFIYTQVVLWACSLESVFLA